MRRIACQLPARCFIELRQPRRQPGIQGRLWSNSYGISEYTAFQAAELIRHRSLSITSNRAVDSSLVWFVPTTAYGVQACCRIGAIRRLTPWTQNQSSRNWKLNETVLPVPLLHFRAAKADAAGRHQVGPMAGRGTCRQQRDERSGWV
jgi:hypothetical protein